MLIIRREGDPRAERAVRVTQSENGRFWWVNPRSQIVRATGCNVTRMGCIVSFAAGLKAAGHRVMIDDRRDGRHPHKYEFVFATHSNIMLYWLVGFAWGQRNWEELVRALQRDVKMEKWYAVLEATASFYMTHPYQSLRLIVPLD